MVKQIGVLVADDSAYMRKVISDMLNEDPQITVIETARDGLDALEKIKKLHPDVVTLDVEMPKMDGLTALQHIMEEVPTAVVMVSSLTQDSSKTTIKALSLGAVDFVPKPSGSISLDIHKVKADIISKVKTASKVSLQKVKSNSIYLQTMKLEKPKSNVIKPVGVKSKRAVLIGSSTGGPGALLQVIPKLPANLQAGILVVQHMPPGFTNSLAKRLNDLSMIQVKEAEQGDIVVNGCAYVAPGGYHMIINDQGIIEINQDPPKHSVRPAADVTFASAVKYFGKNAVGVILTGMGFDGAEGMAMLKKAGGKTIAQDEASSIVYGMPKVVVEMGNADKVLAVNEIAESIIDFLGISNLYAFK